MQQVTIKDIAKLAGVSVTTVSRALNNAPEINAETRMRVLSICRKTGYRANLLARSLSSSRSHVIAVIPPNISSPFQAALCLNIEMCAREQNYQVLLCCDSDPDQLDSLVDFLVGQRVDGILLPSSNSRIIEYLAQYSDQIPSVLIGSFIADDSPLRLNSVSTDNFMGGRIAAEYLYGLGHRSVAYLGFRPDSLTHIARRRGFLQRAEELGMRVDTIVNTDSSSTLEGGYRLAKQLFASSFFNTAIFSVSDTVALGVMQAADEAGISIPEKLSLLGYDNIDYAALPNIRLTTIDHPIPSLARSGTKLLLDLIESGNTTEHTRKLIMPKLIERRTCRKI